MDEDIARWILEYLLRQPIDERVVNDLLSLLPLSNNDNRLLKTLLLRRIESEISNGSISEKFLDFLELIEELDHRECKTASESMKLAYCAVAVDCTIRFLEDGTENNEKYNDTVQRVWRDKVCVVEGLKSEESNLWYVKIEDAVWDTDIRGEILMRNTRNEALKAVRVYLKEAWESIGPTFLELVAEKFGNTMEGFECGGDSGGRGGGVVVSDNPCRELALYKGPPKSLLPPRRKHIATKSKRQRGAKLSSANEGIERESMNKSKRHGGDEGNEVESMNVSKAAPTPEVDRVRPALRPSSTEQNAAEETGSIANEAAVKNPAGVDIKSTSEVDRVQKELKSSSMELRAIVRDPLPDALHAAQTLTSTTATNNVNGKTVVANQTGPETHEDRDSTENGTGISEKTDNPTPDTRVNERRPRRSTKRSLMEPNATGHTIEWEDSIGKSPRHSPSRPRLTTPRETKSSPLKSYDGATKFSKRRVRKFWTPLEEDTLRDGIQKFGKGNWKLILHCYREIFQERTEVDLKDKWRNMTRSS